MNSKDLRKGNCILPQHDLDGKYHVVKELGIESINNYIESWYSPIPLTPEILEQCGFILNNGISDAHLSGMHLYFLEEHDGYYMRQSSDYINRSNPVKYVHHLQNLYFAVTGIEIEIKKLLNS